MKGQKDKVKALNAQDRIMFNKKKNFATNFFKQDRARYLRTKLQREQKAESAELKLLDQIADYNKEVNARKVKARGVRL